MARTSASASGETGARLRQVAGTDLYRRNAFRVTGLPTDADRRTVRSRQQHLVGALSVGAAVEIAGAAPAGLDEVRAAFDTLGDPRRRIVDELFWLWGAPTACSCPPTLHKAHDDAVRAHSAVLDREEAAAYLTVAELRALDTTWTDAAARWTKVLNRDQTWDHLRHRIAALDVPELDDSAVDVIRDAARRTLVTPVVELAAAASDPGRLVAHARRWPMSPGELDDRLEAIAAPRYDELSGVLDEAAVLLDAGRPEEAAGVVRARCEPALARLTAIVPPDRHRRTQAMCDGAATLLNNCGNLALDRGGLAAVPKAREWFDAAHRLAVGTDTRSVITQNRAEMDQIVRVFADLEDKIMALASWGRRNEARAILRQARRSLAGGPMVGEIDRMLARISPWWQIVRTLRSVRLPSVRLPSVRLPSVRLPGRFRIRRVHLPEWFRRVAPALGAAAALVVGIVLVWGQISGGAPPPTVALFSERIVDNPPLGTCIPTEQDWNTRMAPATDSCAGSHWGEVLGYPEVGAVPSAYPGRDQVHALAAYECRKLLLERDLSEDRYLTRWVVGDAAAWNSGTATYENYATCVVRSSDTVLPPGRVLPPPTRSGVGVPMSLTSRELWANAPVGACLPTRDVIEADLEAVPVLPCEQEHWGELLAYPTLYEPGTPFPGETAAREAATAACEKVGVERGLPPGVAMHVAWFPGQGWWDDPKQRIYTACVAQRVDDTLMIGRLG